MFNKIGILFGALIVTSCAHAVSDSSDKHSVCSAVSLVMKSSALAPYYHIETFPERLPITILLNLGANTCGEMELFNKTVRFLGERPKTSSPYFDVLYSRKDNDRISIEVKFPAEGILVIYSLSIKESGGWYINDAKLVER